MDSKLQTGGMWSKILSAEKCGGDHVAIELFYLFLAVVVRHGGTVSVVVILCFLRCVGSQSSIY